MITKKIQTCQHTIANNEQYKSKYHLEENIKIMFTSPRLFTQTEHSLQYIIVEFGKVLSLTILC